jgi:hypothetical protein
MAKDKLCKADVYSCSPTLRRVGEELEAKALALFVCFPDL